MARMVALTAFCDHAGHERGLADIAFTGDEHAQVLVTVEYLPKSPQFILAVDKIL